MEEGRLPVCPHSGCDTLILLCHRRLDCKVFCGLLRDEVRTIRACFRDNWSLRLIRILALGDTRLPPPVSHPDLRDHCPGCTQGHRAVQQADDAGTFHHNGTHRSALDDHTSAGGSFRNCGRRGSLPVQSRFQQGHPAHGHSGHGAGLLFPVHRNGHNDDLRFISGTQGKPAQDGGEHFGLRPCLCRHSGMCSYSGDVRIRNV